MAEEDTGAAHAGKTSILKGWATLIAAVAALVTAISALLKPPQEPAAKATYETLAAVVKESSEQNAKNHDDIENLRNFMEGYIRGNDHTPAPTVDAGTPTTAASGLRLTTRPAASAASGRPSIPPPLGGPRPPVWSPPDFSQMKK